MNRKPYHQILTFPLAHFLTTSSTSPFFGNPTTLLPSFLSTSPNASLTKPFLPSFPIVSHHASIQDKNHFTRWEIVLSSARVGSDPPSKTARTRWCTNARLTKSGLSNRRIERPRSVRAEDELGSTWRLDASCCRVKSIVSKVRLSTIHGGRVSGARGGDRREGAAGRLRIVNN
ncbi:BQ5605_C042g12036 [Microbotryum silenes-dioicae]|uniref:BQ5605_C042g12036 protein n=1 Tax=Microbotryum silenes-dioicae TaxID=796604 RepID=A0A2X0MQG1_9BASI|nr:BQ5605_C042g12036 [Microbotryum silenes-dioicae]